MKKIFLSALTTILTAVNCAAYAADLDDLAINAPTLQRSAAAELITMPPDITEAVPVEDSTKWYASDARRTVIEFTSYVLYAVPNSYTGQTSNILSDPEQRRRITAVIDRQVRHMHGALRRHPDFKHTPGVPSGAYTFTIVRAESVAGNVYAKIHYSYRDTMVFADALFLLHGDQRNIRFVLPKDPLTIYDKGFAASGSGKNLCTDDHYNSRGEFWYFWNPYNRHCPVTEADLVTVEADLRSLKNTRGTYPEYAKLYAANGRELRVTLIVGTDTGLQPGDLGRRTFDNAFAGLREEGFRVITDEPFYKTLTRCFGAKCVRISMRFMARSSAGFAREVVRGLNTSDIFIYDGHSGLGRTLNIERLSALAGERVSLPKDKYQILYFRGCNTYPYYNGDFFRQKRSNSDPAGTRNLDIITTGTGATFEAGARSDVSFLKSVATGERPSWQTIIRRIRLAERFNSALTHVNGDEDNPTTPQ